MILRDSLQDPISLGWGHTGIIVIPFQLSTLWYLFPLELTPEPSCSGKYCCELYFWLGASRGAYPLGQTQSQPLRKSVRPNPGPTPFNFTKYFKTTYLHFQGVANFLVHEN